MQPSYARAQQLYDQEQYSEAEILLQQVVQDNPGLIDALILLSATLYEVWRPEEQLQVAERAIALDPHNSLAMIEMSKALSHNKQYPKALQSVEQILAKEPRNRAALRIKASIFGKTGQIGTAIAMLDSLQSGGEIDYQALLVKAALLSELDRHSEAILIGRTLVEMRPDLVSSHIALASFLGVAGNSREAFNEVKRAKQMNNRDFRVWIAEGAAYLAIGKQTDALNAYNRAVLFNPKSTEVKHMRKLARPAWVNAIGDFFERRKPLTGR